MTAYLALTQLGMLALIGFAAWKTLAGLYKNSS